MTSLLLCATLLASNVASTEMYELSGNLSTNEFDPTPEYIYDTIYTPMGSEVSVTIYFDELSEEEKNISVNNHINAYPNAVLLGPATKKYNCNSYAWYSQDIATNNYNIFDPSAFIEDGSCFETEGEIGDIVVYYNIDQIIHSGIIVETINGVANETWNGLNLKIVESKWGWSALFRHNGVECPYTASYIQIGDTENLIIKYYRLHPQHSYTNSYLNFKNNKHKAFCECGEWRLENHVVSGINPIYGTASCIYCGAIVDTGFVQGYSVNNSFELINGLYYPVKTMCDDDLTYLSYEESMNYMEVEEYEK